MFFLLSLASAADLLLSGGFLWDGTGSPRKGPVDLLISNDRIVAIGPHLQAPVGATLYDATGTTVLPGLIDSHVHISMDPGSAWRTTTPQEHAALLETHLRALLASGVTTILDPAILPDDVKQVRQQLSEHPGPRFLHLGTPFSPPGGYVSAVIPAFPSVATVEEVETQMTAVAAEAPSGVKVTLEDGMLGPIWPLHSPEILRAIRKGATARGLDVYAHAMSPKEQRLALEVLEADVLVHPLDRPDRNVARMAKNAGVYEMTTLSPAWSLLSGWCPPNLSDPFVRSMVPPTELATAENPDILRQFRRAMLKTVLPHGPFEVLSRTMIPAWNLREHLRQMGAGIRTLRDAGVPLVMCSDSGNWPIIPFLFHGPSTIQELLLLEAAKLTPTEILTAATRTPADMLHLDSEIGTLEVGKIADILVVEGDPLQDLQVLRHPRWIVRTGELRTPADWLQRRP